MDRNRLPLPAAVAALALLAAGAVAELTGARAGVPAQGREWLLAALCTPLGARIAAHRARNACGWLLLAVGMLAALTVAASAAATGPVAWLRGWVWWPGYGLLVLVVLLFPDGRAASRRWWRVAAAVGLATGAGTVALASLALRAPGLLTGQAVVTGGWDRAVLLATTVVIFAGGLLAVPAAVVRIVRQPAGRRAPLIWSAGNAALFAVALLLDVLADVPDMWVAGALAIPAATTIGVLRYGLYDIGLLVHRSLLYGLLTVAGLAAYGALAAVTAWLLPPAGAPAAVAATAVVLLPLRQALQSRLEQALYGLRSRPYDLVSAIGRRATLVTALESLAVGFRLPYAAVHLADRAEDDRAEDDRAGPEASHGRRRSWPVTSLPLTHRGARVGRLVVQQRAPDEPWSRPERRLLDDLAAHLGPATAAARLAHDLRAARERLEVAGQLRRDLHDGVGPALSGVRMLLRAGRMRTADAAARHTLDELEHGLAEAAGEIRRILDGLRPAALDHGLAPALETAARRPCLPVRVASAGDLDGLPEAVQIAAYRVVDEALTNVARHAGAGQAVVTVSRTTAELRVDVTDDGGGAGFDGGGIGVDSMRRRCRDLGGELRLRTGSSGTVVTATFPLS
jgi:signal transduction histidine kinase